MGERALSERWIDERAALLDGGPTTSYAARCWMHQIAQSGPLPIGLAAVAVTLIVEAVEPAGAPVWYAEIGLYPPSAEPGALPLVLVPFPVEVGVVVQERGTLAVRGEPAPGRGVVAVLPDGTAIGCAGPAQPPPALRRKRVRL